MLFSFHLYRHAKNKKSYGSVSKKEDNGVVLNRYKFVFAADTADFVEFEVSPTGFRPSKHLIEAIRNFPRPQTVTDIRAWFGIVNQVAYTFSKGELMQPFRCLLEKNRKYFWDKPNLKNPRKIP